MEEGILSSCESTDSGATFTNVAGFEEWFNKTLLPRIASDLVEIWLWEGHDQDDFWKSRTIHDVGSHHVYRVISTENIL